VSTEALTQQLLYTAASTQQHPILSYYTTAPNSRSPTAAPILQPSAGSYTPNPTQQL
jgi:hypothetical protein